MKMKRKGAWLGFLGCLSCLGILSMQGCPGKSMGGASKQKVAQLEARVAEIESILERVGLKPSSKPVKVPLANSPILGDKNAPVSVIAIVDMECPFCGKVQPMLKKLIDDPQLKKGKVNVVLKHFPLSFHKGATPAAKAFMAAYEQSPELAWKMLDKVYASQKELRVSEDKLKEFAKAAKLDEATKKDKKKLLALYLNKNLFSKWVKDLGGNVEAFTKALDDKDKEYQDIIQRDMQLAIKEIKLEGTPTLLVGKRNGDIITAKKLQGLSVNAVKEMIRKEKWLKLAPKAKAENKAKKK